MNNSFQKKSGRVDFPGSRQIVHLDLRTLNAKRVKEMTAQGHGLIQVLGTSDQDCPACRALDGMTFNPTQVPTIPPATCTCLPYCTCVLTVVSKSGHTR